MQGGAENLEKINVHLTSVLTLEYLLDYMISKDLIDHSKKKHIFDELAEPFVPSNSH